MANNKWHNSSILCSKSNLAKDIPGIFCWTKMGSEAGQSLEMILRRKELERQAGNGIFAWGIGNSLGLSPTLAKKEIPGDAVDILFSPMKSSPKAIDVAPPVLALWLAYHSKEGLLDLPEHMLITSRGGNASGVEKRAHYALFCEKHEEIRIEEEQGVIDSRFTRNLISLNPIGASQVTAMVRYDKNMSNNLLENLYPISFRAKMFQEGFVRLGLAIPLTGSLLSTYEALCKSMNVDEWLNGVIELKCQARKSINQVEKQQRLFDFN